MKRNETNDEGVVYAVARTDDVALPVPVLGRNDNADVENQSYNCWIVSL